MPPDFTIPLSALIAAAASGSERDRRGVPEAQVERLRETFDLYRRRNPFVAGELVTPRNGMPISGHGDPHLVLEVIPPATPSFRGDVCCSDKRFDMRLAWVGTDGTVRFAWFESFTFVRWPVGPVLGGTDASVAGPAAA